MAPRRPVIGIMGAESPSPAALEAAGRLGRLVAEAGWILLTGGRPTGVMESANAGAKEVGGSLTIGILPSDQGGPVGAHVDVAVFTGLGNARNAVNVLSSDVVVACGVEGPGTASEVALALKTGRPTILVAASPIASEFFHTLPGAHLLHDAPTPDAVIGIIEQQIGIPRWPQGPAA
jgi:uncharacterized protein (TIGR00725 family)